MTFPSSSIFTRIHCDAAEQPAVVSRAATALQTVKSAISVPENELKRWRRLFDANAKTEVNGEKCVLEYYLISISRFYFPPPDTLMSSSS